MGEYDDYDGVLLEAARQTGTRESDSVLQPAPGRKARRPLLPRGVPRRPRPEVGRQSVGVERMPVLDVLMIG